MVINVSTRVLFPGSVAAQITVTGLQQRTTYAVSVAAVNGIGDPAFSNGVSFTTPPLAPAAVSGLSVNATGSFSTVLQWALAAD